MTQAAAVAVEPSLLDAALDYARRGWRVLPLHHAIVGADGAVRCSCAKLDNCGRNTAKHPRIAAWQNLATTDEATIREWWRQWPRANVGIATGRASGLLVLDVDPDKGGADSLWDLEEAHGRLPATVEAVTGGGGRHILFRHPLFATTSTPGIAPGLDVRGDGAQIVAAPSLHRSGRRYAWEASSGPDDVAIADAPEWLLAMLRTPATKATAPSSHADAPIAEGGRNAHLASLAGAMRRRGSTYEAIRAALDAQNASRCVPPLDADEIEKIARSVARYEPAPAAANDAPSSPAAPLAWRSLAAMARDAARADPPARLPLGLATLDETTHGVPVGARVVLVGAPGAGKTALAVQWAHDWARAGARVVYLAADQAPAAVLVRVGEREGFARADLDGVTSAAARRAAWSELAARVDDLSTFALLDGSDDAATIEAAADLVSGIATNAPRVLVVDSLQTARCAGADGATTPRERIDASLRALRAAQAAGVLVVVVSEMARGGYRSGDPGQNTSALASAKESGSVEYAADLLLGLVSVKGEPDLIDVETAKNRLGEKRDFRLKLERWHAALVETATPTEDAREEAKEAAKSQRRERRIEKAQRAIVDKVLRESLRSKRDIVERIGMKAADVYAAIARLEADRQLVKVDGVYRLVDPGAEGGDS